MHFASGENSGAHGRYANQVDDKEMEHNFENRHNSVQYGQHENMENNNGYGGSMPRSDINSDYNINNQRVPANDLELINNYEAQDQNGFIRKVYSIFTFQILATTAFVGLTMM